MTAPMTPDEMRDILERLGWSQHNLAYAANRDISRIRKQASGRVLIDDALAAWLRCFDGLLDNPPPSARGEKVPDAGTDDLIRGAGHASAR